MSVTSACVCLFTIDALSVVHLCYFILVFPARDYISLEAYIHDISTYFKEFSLKNNNNYNKTTIFVYILSEILQQACSRFYITRTLMIAINHLKKIIINKKTHTHTPKPQKAIATCKYCTVM